ncbi:PLP-dependent cysteine synthase family protein [Persicimonas caeni]|uniref:PLP-dependent cysteine synthase family protein n=1 Tax=Persicimonas caeni TaxID=2292766 RepID=UPI001C9A319C|nr:cysteine synthase family protein [Persicimonas caeni]
MSVRSSKTKKSESRPLAPTPKKSLLEMVGNTPMVRLEHVTSHLPDEVEVWAKLEFMNPGGSVKDRPARQIILDALETGELTPEKTLIDSTSGNTGIAYAMIGAAVGIDVALVMPENVSPARKHIVSTFGAEIIYSDPMDGSDGAQRLCKELVDNDEEGKYFYANQYGNPNNPGAHVLTTAPEIWEQTDGRVTHFVASTGTSGTIMGVTRGLKQFNSDIQTYGAQPSDAFHGLEGLKHMPSAIVPDIYHEDELSGVIYVDTEDGWDMAEKLARTEGIAAGNSAGANVWAALKVAEELDEGVVVTVICDHADRYLGQ